MASERTVALLQGSVVSAVPGTIRRIDETVDTAEGLSSQSPAFMHHNRRDVFLQLLLSVNIP